MDALTNIHVHRAATVNQNCDLNDSFLSNLYVFVTSIFFLCLYSVPRNRRIFIHRSVL